MGCCASADESRGFFILFYNPLQKTVTAEHFEEDRKKAEAAYKDETKYGDQRCLVLIFPKESADEKNKKEQVVVEFFEKTDTSSQDAVASFVEWAKKNKKVDVVENL